MNHTKPSSYLDHISDDYKEKGVRCPICDKITKHNGTFYCGRHEQMVQIYITQYTQ